LKKPFFDELNRPVCTTPQGSQLAIYVRDQNFKKRLRQDSQKTGLPTHQKNKNKNNKSCYKKYTAR